MQSGDLLKGQAMVLITKCDAIGLPVVCGFIDRLRYVSFGIWFIYFFIRFFNAALIGCIFGCHHHMKTVRVTVCVCTKE